MLTPRDADRAIGAALVAVLGQEAVALRAAVGRVLAEPVAADQDQPPFDRVAMDGIAIRAAAFVAGRRQFRVVGTQGAGAEPQSLVGDDECWEIMTGAMLPPGADTVVPVERLTLADGAACVADTTPVVAGWNVHRRGSDRRQGSRVLEAGIRLSAPEVAVLAAVGMSEVPVRRQPRIAVVSTGDELVETHVVPKPWQVRRSNAYAILAALAARGYQGLVDTHLPDDPQVLVRALAGLLAEADVLVLSGGVSAGRYDHVPAALAKIGVSQRFHKVEQRPGRPLWFGTGSGGQLVFGLPGNPVSTLICLVRYVLPALAWLEGEPPRTARNLALAAEIHPPGGLTLFMPVELGVAAGEPVGIPRPTHGSGDFLALTGTAGFVEVGPEQGTAPGERVPFYHW